MQKTFFLLFIISLKLFSQNLPQNYQVKYPEIPQEVFFCGERVPINQFDILERFEKEMIVNTYWHSKTLLTYKRSKKYFSAIEQILRQNNMPDDLKYLVVAESGLENLTSPAGAKGFWQFMEKTAQQYNLEISKEIDERYNLEKSSQAACEYLQKLYNMFNNWTLAAAAYNMGENALKRNIKKQKVNNYYDLKLNNETSRYIFRIVSYKTIYENPENYGFKIKEHDFPKNIETYNITVKESIENLAEYALDLGVNYKIIKNFNPWILKNNLIINPGQSYNLTIPKKKHIIINSEINYDTIFYKIERKDDIHQIARKFNIDVSQLLYWNNMFPNDKLKKGKQLLILQYDE